MSKYDYLIVGSGLFGATFAYRAIQQGKRCLVIDKRPHLGGNVYCEPYSFPTVEGRGEDVINVHKYGAHIFHTNNKEVWDFVNSFVEFNRYTNSPIANYRGELYNLPFNMNTFNRMWPDVHTPAQAEAKLAEQRASLNPSRRGTFEPKNLEEQAISLVGEDIYRKLIKEYTEKQWGRDCKELPASIIKRLPVRMIFDNNYFNDRYQGIPIGGYNKLIEGLLSPTPTLPRRRGGIFQEQSAQEEGRIDTLVGISVPLNAPKRGVYEGKAAYREKADVINYSLQRVHSRMMRKEPTEAESFFWSLVRGNQMGCKFRRQHAIGEYIVDFISLQKNLIVELDGGYHFTEEQQIEDAKRTRILNEYGYTVLRLRNEEVIGNPEGAIEKVRLAMSISENLPQLGGLRGAFSDSASLLLGGLRGAKLVYTGPLDQYFDYCYGKLDWRTVTFKTRIEDTPNYQGNAVINYTSHEQPYTRVIEHKHFEMFGQQVYDCLKTVISEEYSTEYRDGMEPYYPVNDERNNALAEKYRELAHSEGVLFPEDMNSLPTGEGRGESIIIFGGRLAEYKYYDMAPIIEKVLSIKQF